MKVYTNRSEKLWKKGKIAKKDMTVKYLKFPTETLVKNAELC